MGMSIVLICIIRTAKQPFDFSEVNFYMKSFDWIFSMDRSLEGISSLINIIILPPLELRSNLCGSLNPFIRNWPFGKVWSNLVSDIMSMSMFPVVISIKLSNFCLIELTDYNFTEIFLTNILETFYIYQRTFRCCLIFTTVTKTITVIISFSKAMQ